MTPMKMRVLKRLAILAVVAAAGFFVLVVTTPEPPVSKRSFAQIDGTMTEKDLTAFLGPANGDYTMLAKRAYSSDTVSFTDSKAVSSKIWQGKGQGILVTFGEDGRVKDALYVRYEREENLIAKLKRWLRLS